MNTVFLLAPKDFVTFKRNYKLFKKNLPKGDFYIISPSVLKDDIEKLGCIFVDEDKLYEGLSLEKIKSLVKERIGVDAWSTWYFQQFLKMAFAFKDGIDEYIIWDSDTIPVKPYEINKTSPVFDMKYEFHRPYFFTMQQLFPNLSIDTEKRNEYGSYISEHMFIISSYMKEVINSIEKNENIPGKTFFEKIINAIDIRHILNSGFSEYETYGTYMRLVHPNVYQHRKWESLREKEINFFPFNTIKSRMAKWLSKSFDAVTIEKRVAFRFNPKLAIYMKIVSFFWSYEHAIKVYDNLAEWYYGRKEKARSKK